MAGRVGLDDVIYGLHAIEEALIAGEPLQRIHVAQHRRQDRAVQNVLQLAKGAGAHVRFEDQRFFAQFPYKAHQGVIAIAPPFAYVTLEEALAKRKNPALFVVLDHITDPHNAGAIIRTAESAGADAVILPERRSAGVNATVRKAAAGAAAHLSIARVANIAETARKLKKAGVWVAGADPSADSVPYWQADFTADLALMIGAEGRGLSPVVLKECDLRVGIPMSGKVQSLNASVATAVLLYEAVRQRRAPIESELNE
ncbi:MAG TPA: 23S rRNA (guanosine(2251)-2'-O)-methyltransferase RlmB [Candidatus Rubrimentiphilum sp.]|nr:23S rRNA (guanosine(2251)-2'-O)-methyltransferase RlmB [Candidatus Rubrimentiphilum sp.]